ncbi:MAG: prepilin peptidase [Vulcanimicrobiaceae bacterium]
MSLGMLIVGMSVLFTLIAAAGKPTLIRQLDEALIGSILVCGVATAALAVEHRPGFGPELGILMGALVASTWTDLRLGLIVDRVTLPASVSVLALLIVGGHAIASIVGMAGASAVLLALHMVTRGRGMGLGDVKLAAVIGASLGLYRSVVALGCAFVLGAIVGVVILSIRRARRGAQVAFAPYLAIGSIAAILLVGSP